VRPGIKKRVRSLTINNRSFGRARHSGIALLVLMIAIALTISAYYFSSISIVDIQVNNMEVTRKALKDAKKALLSYAVMHAGLNGAGTGAGSGDPGEYGYLPCPYITQALASDEGQQNTSCGGKNISSIGYLPWKSLQSGILKDGSGSCLWYAVSGSYKNWSNSELINEDTNGMFQIVDSSLVPNVIQGVQAEDRVVAIVFAPGATLAAQNRDFNNASLCGRDGTNVSAYLEGNASTNNATLTGVAEQIDQFIQASITSDTAAVPYNDYFITITRDEIWQAVMKTDLENKFAAAAEAVAWCLSEYVNHVDNPNKRLPWPAPLDLVDYSVLTNYDDVPAAAQGYAGRFPLYINDSNGLIVTSVEDEFLNPGVATPPAGRICNSLNLPVAGLVNVDLTDEKEELRVILNNWKDHIYYSASQSYSLPDVAWTGCGASDCVEVAGTKYAAIIYFAGRKQGVQSRVFDTISLTDEKNDIFNYLENGNAAIFVNDMTGNGAYNTAVLPSNDIMFCLTDSAIPSVVPC